MKVVEKSADVSFTNRKSENLTRRRTVNVMDVVGNWMQAVLFVCRGFSCRSSAASVQPDFVMWGTVAVPT